MIIVLLLYSLFQTWQSNHLAGDIKKLKVECQDKVKTEVAKAIKPYEQAIAKAHAEALAKEKIYQSNLLKAEQNANQKIKAANDDALAADRAANSLSKQLSEAKRSLSNASRETIIKYIIIQSDVFEQCTAEYTKMARSCDAERIDKEKLIDAWPE
ncbi:hypothetical protein [Acinetobacter rudis]|uniref:hypothetical protein n=1 Tax=Acinetobacter rudis TaxID=632955 RepID=UPI003342AD5E